MRTMFISLILICWLAHLASPTRVRYDQPPPELNGCGTIYQCYVPEMCNKMTVTFQDSSVEPVTNANDIFKDCPALIRFHLYARHRAFVTIEALVESTAPIAFIRKGADHRRTGPEASFSCAPTSVPNKSNWKFKIFYETLNNINLFKTGEGTFDYEKTFDSKKIRCEFEVLVARKYEVLKSGTQTRAKYQFIIGNDNAKIETKWNLNAGTNAYPDLQCNPELLKYKKDNIDPKKKYEEVSYSPGKFYCKKDNIFKLEYLKAANDKKYTEITKIECSGGNNFVVDGQAINDELNIRCAADLLLFCDKGVKNKDGESGLEYVAPDEANGKLSTLKCPGDKPHLVVSGLPGLEKPIQYAKFECLPYNDEQYWTFQGPNNKSFPLDSKSPEVYCTKDLDCNLHFKILQNNVINGYLDEKTLLPKCFDKGELHVIDASVIDGMVKIDKPYCNFVKGDYQYVEIVSKAVKAVNKETKFKCKYPIANNEALKTSQTQKAWSFGVVGFVAAGLIGFAIIGVLTFLTMRKQKKILAMQKEREKEQMAAGDKAWLQYCMNDFEKAEYKEQHPDAKSLKSLKEPDANLWNKMLMNFQRKSLELAGPADELAKPRPDRVHWFSDDELENASAANTVYMNKMNYHNSNKRAPEVLGRYEQHIAEESGPGDNELVSLWNAALMRSYKAKTVPGNKECKYDWERLGSVDDMKIPTVEVNLLLLDGSVRPPPPPEPKTDPEKVT